MAAIEEDVILNPTRGAMNTAASNPGCVRARLTTVLRCYPHLAVFPVLIMLGGMFIAVTVTLGGDPAALLVLPICGVFAGIILWYLFLRPKATARSGCLLPAVVVDGDSSLVAAVSNLSKLGGKDDHVKVFKAPLKRSGQGSIEAGKKCPVVALYEDANPRSASWSNFLPYPVVCLTDVRATHDRVLKQIPPEDWQELKTALRQIERPFRPGLYPVQV